MIAIPQYLRTLFQSSETQPLTLIAILTKHFGGEWLNWEPVTLWDEIRNDFHAPISHVNKERLLAARLVITMERFFDEWDVFTHVVDALNGKIPNFAVLQDHTPGEIMAAVEMAQEMNREADFSDEVERFIVACFLHHGVYCLPAPVDFAQDLAAKPIYTCLDCGNVDTDDNGDGLCDVCSGRFLGEKSLDGRASQEKGGRIVRTLTHDPAPVAMRLAELGESSIEKLREGIDVDDPIDVQASKLLAAQMYVGRLRSLHKGQMEKLRGWITV